MLGRWPAPSIVSSLAAGIAAATLLAHRPDVRDVLRADDDERRHVELAEAFLGARLRPHRLDLALDAAAAARRSERSSPRSARARPGRRHPRATSVPARPRPRPARRARAQPLPPRSRPARPPTTPSGPSPTPTSTRRSTRSGRAAASSSAIRAPNEQPATAAGRRSWSAAKAT